MINSFSVHLDNKLEALEEINSFVQHIAAKYGWEESLVFKITLVIEEFFTNIVKYGIRDSANHSIELKIGELDEGIGIELIDDGVEFNPLEQDSPDTEADLEDRSIGGLGIHLSRNLSESIEYKRIDDKNYIKIFIKYGS
jgi:anti-sigma regulatory factor (Ser/Thr protein kinase)